MSIDSEKNINPTDQTNKITMPPAFLEALEEVKSRPPRRPLPIDPETESLHINGKPVDLASAILREAEQGDLQK